MKLFERILKKPFSLINQAKITKPLITFQRQAVIKFIEKEERKETGDQPHY